MLHQPCPVCGSCLVLEVYPAALCKLTVPAADVKPGRSVQGSCLHDLMAQGYADCGREKSPLLQKESLLLELRGSHVGCCRGPLLCA